MSVSSNLEIKFYGSFRVQLKHIFKLHPILEDLQQIYLIDSLVYPRLRFGLPATAVWFTRDCGLVYPRLRLWNMLSRKIKFRFFFVNIFWALTENMNIFFILIDLFLKITNIYTARENFVIMSISTVESDAAIKFSWLFC
jgi:hypothetical protein